MKRPAHFNEYAEMTEVIPGVFVNPGDSVHIVDDIGEVVSWTASEWLEDPEAVTATVNACILAATKGPSAVRTNIANRGSGMIRLIEETYERVYA